MNVRLGTYRAMLRVPGVRTDLLKHFVEIFEYQGILLDQFFELQNCRGKLLLLNVAHSRRADSVPDELSEQFALELPEDVGIPREPSSDGPTVFYLRRHIDLTAEMVHCQRTLNMIIGVTTHNKLETNDEETKGERWDLLY